MLRSTTCFYFFLTHAGNIQSNPAPKCSVATTHGNGSSLSAAWLDLSRAAPSANISATNAAAFGELIPPLLGVWIYNLCCHPPPPA